tara:strand:- start:7823 stop:8473 length:651 start_codon:yes stop_codon:yes gene_type:complete
MKKSVILLSILFTALVGCKNEAEDLENLKTEKIEETDGFQNIEILFDESEFTDPVMKELLLELKICSEDENLIQTSEVPPCTAEKFKFLPLQDKLSLKNGFILLIKAKTAGFPLRRILIFQRERGNLVKTNGFVANIIGRTKSQSGYDDLLLRFNDKDQGEDMFYNCLFSWEDGKYQYKQVEVIQGANWGGPVKAMYKDSISKEIYQNIMNNEMIF